MFRPLLIGQFTRRAFSWLPIIRVSLSLSLTRSRYTSYIKQRASSNGAPHHQTGINLNATTRTKLVIRIIRKGAHLERGIMVRESRFSVKIPFVSRHRGGGEEGYFPSRGIAGKEGTSGEGGREGSKARVRYKARRESASGEGG